MTMGRQHCSQVARLIALPGKVKWQIQQFVLVLQNIASGVTSFAASAVDHFPLLSKVSI